MRQGRQNEEIRTVCPAEKSGDNLKDLEFFRIGALERKEMDEVVGYELSGLR